MAEDAPEECLRQHAAIMEDLARMLKTQHAMHQRVEACMQRQDTVNEHLNVTQASVETLRVWMLPTWENGRRRLEDDTA